MLAGSHLPKKKIYFEKIYHTLVKPEPKPLQCWSVVTRRALWLLRSSVVFSDVKTNSTFQVPLWLLRSRDYVKTQARKSLVTALQRSNRTKGSGYYAPA